MGGQVIVDVGKYALELGAALLKEASVLVAWGQASGVCTEWFQYAVVFEGNGYVTVQLAQTCVQQKRSLLV